jgi:hypothetical protein
MILLVCASSSSPPEGGHTSDLASLPGDGEPLVHTLVRPDVNEPIGLTELHATGH